VSIDDQQFVDDTVNNGGASRHARTMLPPPPHGFMVGGAMPERSLASHQFHAQAVHDHARAIQEHFPQDAGHGDIYQGSWAHGGKYIMDASQYISDRLTAKTVARQRGEQAIYDLGGQRDIQTAPGAHRAGAHKATRSSPANPTVSSGSGTTPTPDLKGGSGTQTDAPKHRYQGKHVAGSHKAGAHKR